MKNKPLENPILLYALALLRGRLLRRQVQVFNQSGLSERLDMTDTERAFQSDRNGSDAVLGLVAALHRDGQPIPDELEERALRIQLEKNPYDYGLTRSLVALLHRLGRPPVPEPSPHLLVPDADVDGEGLRMLQGAEEVEYAQTGDTYSVYAALWQVVVRYPQSARGWAEYARAFANRGEWENCRAAIRHAFALRLLSDTRIADVLLQALGTLAESKQLGDLAWREWLSGQPEAFHSLPGAVQLLLRTGHSQEAAAATPILINRLSHRADAWLAAAKVEFEYDNLLASYDCLRRAFELDLRGVIGAVIRDFSSQFARVTNKLGKGDELADWISDLSGDDDVNLIPTGPSPESLMAVRRFRSEALERGLPSALLVTQGKSASVTVGNIFSSGFQLPTMLYSIVNIRVVESWLRSFLLGGVCYVTHLRPTDRNIELLRAAGVKNMIVHVRDPRQVFVSWIQHYRSYPEQLGKASRETLMQSDEERVFRYTNEIFRSAMIWWIDSWYASRGKLGVQFTTFEEFVRDRSRFTERIISLYGGDARYFNPTLASNEHAGVDYHRRLGAVDEWRTVLTPKQIDELNSAMPDYFWSEFGWDP